MKLNPDDQHIISQFNRGGKHANEAFQILVRKYGPILYRMIRNDTKNHELTNDILQDVFLKVFQSLKDFKGESQLFSWLYRITKNQTINSLKKEKFRTNISLDQSIIERLSSKGSFGDLSEEEIESQLKKAIDSLPEKQKIIFELKYFQELKYQEISTITGTSIGGCKANYHHAKEKILTFLRNQLNLF